VSAKLPDVLRVTVTQEDIGMGVVGDCWNCPIALAVSALIDDSVEVTATELRAHETDEGGYPRPVFYELSHRARKFIKDFDDWRRRDPGPATFVLRRDKDFTR